MASPVADRGSTRLDNVGQPHSVLSCLSTTLRLSRTMKIWLYFLRSRLELHATTIQHLPSMASTRLCRVCRDFQLSEALEELGDKHLEDVYRISHAEFFECASSCDICNITASHFLKSSRPSTELEDEEQATIIASIRNDDGNNRLIFFNKMGWDMVN